MASRYVRHYLSFQHQKSRHSSMSYPYFKVLQEQTRYITAWTRLTKIVRSISDLLFPSATTTGQIIRSGRYISITEHIQALLSVWSEEYKELIGE